MKADYFADFIAKSPQQLIDRLALALNAFMDDRKIVASQCAFRK